jgi:hypothetical protein
VKYEKPKVPDTARVRAALQQAVEDYDRDLAAGNPPRGIAILLLHETEGRIRNGWIVEGLTTIETIGLLAMCTSDMNDGIGDDE